MARPSPAIIGSIALHAGVGALLFFVLTQRPPEPTPLVTSIPVSIISDTITVEAAPGENPTDEVVPETETAPPPEPTPPPPTPRPTPIPNKTTTPTRPPRPPVTQPREEPSLNTEDLLSGSRRRADRNNRRNLPPSGDRGQADAPRAIGRGDLQTLGRQVRPTLNCNLPGADGLEVRVRVRLGDDGRIIGSPQLLRPRSDAAYRAVSDSVLRGVRAAAPFDMPAGYEEQDINFVFNTSTWC
ncbi:MAG TPA: cell envelope integrity protein TolA [Brevundimonas sp.]